MTRFFFLLLAPFFMMANGVSAEISKPEVPDTVIVVDKKENKIHLGKNVDGAIEPFKTYDATLGQVVGDKNVEGDLKTPEGIYEILFQARPDTGLKPKFGTMALYVSYPNIVDKKAHKTGFDILIHGTNDPSRLERKYDSKGCVVVSNEQISDIWPHVRLKNTRVIITEDFGKLQNAPRKQELEGFLHQWLDAWSGKDLDTYLESYAYEFTYDGMNRIQYGRYKDRLNKVYDKIKVTANDVRYYFHEKYDMVTFHQTYESYLPNGKIAFRGEGKKVLYVQMRNGEYKIIAEDLKKI